ncbi:hypothetical protein OH76DRAFT_1171598 [Lentinus brumalis]|uniref:Uncharacterized protein n=1 Tax=Lentinus brumalis TaxID=2498619 RepID=A0A371CUB8_9APHY|nr:hypothetical protein OH76DRAFT_1171598 [Polyporus brumalis]
MFVRARADSYLTATYVRRHVPRSEHPHDFRWHTHDYIQESASPSATPDSNTPTDAIIGAAAAGSVVFLIGAIFLGYWLTKRRTRRRCPPSQIWISFASRTRSTEESAKAQYYPCHPIHRHSSTTIMD